MKLDEVLRRELERVATPGDPNGVYERVARRTTRLCLRRQVGMAVLSVVVVVGSVGGIWALSSVFRVTDGRGVAAPTVTNGAIVFERDARDGEGDQIRSGSHLWLVMPDGTRERQFTFADDVYDRWAAWSPDGASLAFVRLDYVNASFGLWVTDVTGGEPSMVTPPGIGAARPDWSPDGSRIVFAGVMGETPESGIYVVNADGTDLGQITGPEFLAPDNPEWSPDGSRIAFSGNLDDSRHSWDVYVMHPDGSELRNLTRTPDEERSEWLIGWLPNGNLLVSQGPGEIASGPGLPLQTERWLEITDSGDVVHVAYEGPANTPEARQGPSLSPDGRFVVFDTPDEGGNTIRFADLKTGEVTEVTTRGTTPAWQPVPAGSSPGAPPSPTGATGPTGPTGPTSKAGEELGLGFAVCFVERLRGIDFTGDGTDGNAWTAVFAKEDGRCPEFPKPDRYLLAVDHTGDQVADSWIDLPFECYLACPPFDATDLDGDGTEELIVTSYFSIMDYYFFTVRPNANGVLRVEPILVADPGHPPAGIASGVPLRIDAGGDAGYASTIRCEGYPGVPVIVWSWSSGPVEGNEPTEAHVTRIELRDGWFHVVGSDDSTVPAGQDPGIGIQSDLGRECGVHWYP